MVSRIARTITAVIVMAKSKDKVAIKKVIQVRGFGSLEIEIDDPSDDVCSSGRLYFLLS